MIAETLRLSEEGNDDSVYITDRDGNVFLIDHFPFIIGRKKMSEGTDLSLPHIAEISGIHAAIYNEGGSYWLYDQRSTNGTFIKRDDCEPFSDECRIEKEELFDGSVFFLYRTKFTFHIDCRASQTCLVTDQTASTMLLDDSGNAGADEYEAFLETEKGRIPVSSFPFEYEDLTITVSSSYRRIRYMISSDHVIIFEGEMVSPGTQTELFSGCSFICCSNAYKFFIK